MDPVARAFFELHYELAFLKRKADEFQDFFSSIMEMRYPADFVRVRPWGKTGDKKNDGYLRSKRTLFQSYAPNDMEASKAIAKIDEDFTGALPHWKAHFDVWIFVHNSRDGLGPDVLKKLLDLDAAHPITVTQWGFPELRTEVFQLEADDLAALFGAPPTRAGMLALALDELGPVLDQLAVLPPAADPDLRPVPSDKLQANMLSDHVAVLLKAGMTRADLVGKLLRAQPGRQDEIAESFRKQYAALRGKSLSPDGIFSELQQYAGGERVPTPARQNAVLAVLAFFFENCDIFERPSPVTS